MILLQNGFNKGVFGPLVGLKVPPALHVVQVQHVLAADCIQEDLNLCCKRWLEMLSQIPGKVELVFSFELAVFESIVSKLIVRANQSFQILQRTQFEDFLHTAIEGFFSTVNDIFICRISTLHFVFLPFENNIVNTAIG